MIYKTRDIQDTSYTRHVTYKTYKHVTYKTYKHVTYTHVIYKTYKTYRDLCEDQSPYPAARPLSVSPLKGK